jgi:hypothetical protein
MRNRGLLYILLTLGVLLIGSGVWLMLDSARAKVDIPESNPVIHEKLDYIMRGEFNYLYIYEDGSIIYIEENGLRMPSPGHPPTRTWKTGELQPEQLNSLLEYLKNSGLEKLDEHYQFPGKPIEGGPAGGFSMGDMGFTISINHENLNKTVTAFGYLTPDHGETYPDMPSPLNEIYIKLRAISLETKEVARENIS